MKKILLMASILALCLVCVVGCSNKEELDKTEPSKIEESKTKTVNIVIPKSPAAVPFLRMVENKGLGENYDIQYKLYSNMEELSALAMGEEFDFIYIAANSASMLYNKGINIKMASTGIWGGMYLVSTDKTVTDWKDLKGKTLYIPNRGSVPDIMTQYFIKKAGLKIDTDIEIVYSTHPEISQLINIGSISNAVDAEPFATANKNKVSGYNIVSDYIQAWKNSAGDEFNLPNMCVCVNTKIADEKNDLVKLFNNSYEEATNWTKNNPSEAAVIAEKYLNIDAKLMENAIPNIRFEFKSANDSKQDLNKYYEVLFEVKPECIGGKVPDEDFYFTEK